MKSLSLFAGLLLNSLLATAAPAPDLQERSLEERQIIFPKCMPTGKDYCTVYMATGDTKDEIYRTAALFDNNCKLTQAIMTDKTNPKITLKGHMKNYADIRVDDFYRPRGWLSYLDEDTPLGDNMVCYKYPGTDGVGCRKAFWCG
ncbi:hypothetical protein F4821DRAFT_179817 [Hypoxylon rubiginosum]|uniref:Uncharacterized protein n=1 Tax=Hypoxylon rubiginosum TaxID=110542 RepID=A0ACC0CUB0_9PEZI|nr:hypothetical protein F4821DRAFT_179817 [Hypoxylon rubiginosum]